MFSSIFFLFLAFYFSGCGCSNISNEEQWKCKYDLEPGTSVLAGKIELKDFLLNREVYLFLKDGRNGKVIAYDNVSDSGYILIKNINPGMYYIDFYPDEIPREDTPRLVGRYIFAGYNCKSFYIEIKTDQIMSIEEIMPGTSTMVVMPMVQMEGYPQPTVDKDSCEVKRYVKLLNKENYLEVYTQRNN